MDFCHIGVKTRKYYLLSSLWPVLFFIKLKFSCVSGVQCGRKRSLPNFVAISALQPYSGEGLKCVPTQGRLNQLLSGIPKSRLQWPGRVPRPSGRYHPEKFASSVTACPQLSRTGITAQRMTCSEATYVSIYIQVYVRTSFRISWNTASCVATLCVINMYALRGVPGRRWTIHVDDVEVPLCHN